MVVGLLVVLGIGWPNFGMFSCGTCRKTPRNVLFETRLVSRVISSVNQCARWTLVTMIVFSNKKRVPKILANVDDSTDIHRMPCSARICPLQPHHQCYDVRDRITIVTWVKSQRRKKPACKAWSFRCSEWETTGMVQRSVLLWASDG